MKGDEVVGMKGNEDVGVQILKENFHPNFYNLVDEIKRDEQAGELMKKLERKI
jgi:hypothetical protein